MNKERGSASITIELKNEVITVYHNEDGSVLKTFEAYEGSWDRIWKGIDTAESSMYLNYFNIK